MVVKINTTVAVTNGAATRAMIMMELTLTAALVEVKKTTKVEGEATATKYREKSTAVHARGDGGVRVLFAIWLRAQVEKPRAYVLESFKTISFAYFSFSQTPIHEELVSLDTVNMLQNFITFYFHEKTLLRSGISKTLIKKWKIAIRKTNE